MAICAAVVVRRGGVGRLGHSLLGMGLFAIEFCDEVRRGGKSDGVLQRDPGGNVYTTPCTVRNFPHGTCRVGFEICGPAALGCLNMYDLAQDAADCKSMSLSGGPNFSALLLAGGTT